VAIEKAIDVINAKFDSAQNGYDKEIEMFGKSFGTEDFKEGTQAFLNKEKADFPGK